MTLDEKLDLALKEAQWASDYVDILNLVSAHLYSYRAQKQVYEIENFWSKRDDIAYANVKGRQAVLDYYCKTNERMRAKKLELAHKFHPEIAVDPKNEGVGDMVSKAATTPFVIIADDRRTAQGLFFVPGICSEIGEDGNIRPNYFQEKNGFDFINEDGQWKIWHMNIFVDFMSPLPANMADPANFNTPTVPYAQVGYTGELPMDSQPYGPTRVAGFEPPLPAQYSTWDSNERTEVIRK